MIRSDHASVAMRRQVVLDTLRASDCWMTAREISDIILEETGGAPCIATGALFIPPWTVRCDLLMLEREGAIVRRTANARTVWWRAVPHTTEAAHR